MTLHGYTTGFAESFLLTSSTRRIRNRGRPPERFHRAKTWYAAPEKIFDNLYYVGSYLHSMWAVTTSEGIILHDSAFDYMVEDEIVDGLRQLGLDAADIKYVIISHGHSDHYFGAKTLQDRYGARIIMSEADWNLAANDANPSEIKPRKDMVATDGMELTLGDTTVTLYVTPGHTPGTISTLIPLRDGDRWHLGSIWGGNALGGRHFPERSQALSTYSSSAERFREITARARVDVFLARSLSGIAPSKQESTTYEPSLVCKLLILCCRLLIPDRLLAIRTTTGPWSGSTP